MALHTVKGFVRYASSLAAVEIVEQWDSHVAKVGGKVFALIGVSGDALVFKVSETSFEGLTALPDIGQAPYFAKRGWVRVGRDAPLSDAELKAYIAASHALVVARLTRKLRAELGLHSP